MKLNFKWKGKNLFGLIWLLVLVSMHNSNGQSPVYTVRTLQTSPVKSVFCLGSTVELEFDDFDGTTTNVLDYSAATFSVEILNAGAPSTIVATIVSTAISALQVTTPVYSLTFEIPANLTYAVDYRFRVVASGCNYGGNAVSAGSLMNASDLTFAEAPEVTIVSLRAGIDVACYHENIDIQAIPTQLNFPYVSGDFTYSWGGTTGNSIRAANWTGNTDLYQVVVTNQVSGCTAGAQITVYSNPEIIIPGITNISAPIELTPNSSTLNLDGTASGGVPFLNTGYDYEYLWNPGNGLSSYTIETPDVVFEDLTVNTVYSVTVTDANSCTAAANVEIHPIKIILDVSNVKSATFNANFNGAVNPVSISNLNSGPGSDLLYLGPFYNSVTLTNNAVDLIIEEDQLNHVAELRLSFSYDDTWQIIPPIKVKTNSNLAFYDLSPEFYSVSGRNLNFYIIKPENENKIDVETNVSKGVLFDRIANTNPFEITLTNNVDWTIFKSASLEINLVNGSANPVFSQNWNGSPNFNSVSPPQIQWDVNAGPTPPSGGLYEYRLTLEGDNTSMSPSFVNQRTYSGELILK